MTDTPAPASAGLSMGADALYVEGEVLQRVSRKRVSPSTANAMHGCAARWAAEKALRQEPDLFSPAEIGTGAHSVLEDLYGLEAQARTPQAAMKSLIELAKKTFPDDEVARQMWMSEVSGKYRGIFDMETPADIDVISTEERIGGVEIGGIPFDGVIDRVERLPDGRVKIVDYKTGRYRAPNPEYRDDYAEQMRLYALAWREKSGTDAKIAHLYYTGEGKKRQVAIAKKALAQTKAGYVAAAETLFEQQEAGRFQTQESPLCGWCPLVNICPTAAAAGRTARVPAPSATDLGIPVVRADAAPPSPAAATQPDPVAADAESTVIESSDTEGAIDEGETMSEIRLTDTKPFYEMELGHFNLSSYAAIGVFGVTSMAYEIVRDSEEVELTTESIQSVTRVLAHIILTAQHRMVGDHSGWQEGSNSRVRGLLHTILKDDPLPFGADAQGWEEWAGRIVERLAILASTAVLLAYDQLPDARDAIGYLTGESDPFSDDEGDDEGEDEELEGGEELEEEDDETADADEDIPFDDDIA